MSPTGPERERTSGLSPAAIALGLGASALVWLALDVLKQVF